MVNVQAHEVKNTPDVQIHHLLTRPVRRRLKRSSPCCARIRDEDIKPRFNILHLLDQGLDLIGLRGVSGNPDGFPFDAGEGIQVSDCLVDTFCFAGSYKDGLCAGEEEGCCYVQADAAGCCLVSMGMRGQGQVPPVTKATFPVRSK